MSQVQNQIKALQNQIKQLNEKISEIKNTKTLVESENKDVTISLFPNETQNDLIDQKVSMEGGLIPSEDKEKIKKEIVKEIENAIKELVDKTNENTKNIAINIQKIESNIKIHEDAITKLELNNKKIMI